MIVLPLLIFYVILIISVLHLRWVSEIERYILVYMLTAIIVLMLLLHRHVGGDAHPQPVDITAQRPPVALVFYCPSC